MDAMKLMNDIKSIPLSDLKPEAEAEIVGFDGGAGLKTRLNDMGMHVGSKVELMSGAGKSGPVIVVLDGSRLALGRGVVEKILVKIVNG